MEWNIFSDWKWDWEIQVGYCNGFYPCLHRACRLKMPS
ncbi:hypothetical protein NMBG2136_1118 [Neisseria meningitidis G2136]|nr:hypothetical protein NMBG2136_1118 [Neisseria meningitidis G2136]